MHLSRKGSFYLFNYFDSITVKKRGHFFQRKVFASIRPFVDPPRRQVKKETRDKTRSFIVRAMAQAFNVRLLLIERGRPIQSSVVALDFGTRPD